MLFNNQIEANDVINELTASLALKEKEIAVLKLQLLNYQKKGAEFEQWLKTTAPNLLSTYKRRKLNDRNKKTNSTSS